jgi:hypothetical protein
LIPTDQKATYEKEPESAKATSDLVSTCISQPVESAMTRFTQFKENVFEKGYAHALLAFQGTPDAPGAPLGMALYFFNFSTWTGKPGLYVRVNDRSAIQCGHHAVDVNSFDTNT